MRAMTAAVALLVGATLAAVTIPARAESDAEIEQLVRRHVQPALIAAGGMAVALNIDGRTLLFNYGMADVARQQPITSDSLFNLASVGKAFIATLLAQAVKQGEVSLDDPVAKYVTELAQGGDIRKITLGQLATHTSGLDRTPHQYEPWHRGPYTLADFIRYLNSWTADAAHTPGKQDIYSNTGFVLLSLALERRFNTPIAQLMEQRLLIPLGMTSTALPVPRGNARGQLAEKFRRRAVQGYNADAKPVGEPGLHQAYSPGRAPGRFFPRPATWRAFLPPISARCRSSAICKRRWLWRSKASSR
jgi:beta-lactamase class C